jgi:Bacterial Death-like domain 3
MPKARIEIEKGLDRRWQDLADYFEIPLSDEETFAKGHEPQGILEWLEERKRLGELRDAFDYLGWNDLVEELDSHPY